MTLAPYAPGQQARLAASCIIDTTSGGPAQEAARIAQQEG